MMLRRSGVRRPGALLGVLAVAASALGMAAPPAEAFAVPITQKVVIGHSVHGRAIVAYHRYTAGQLGRPFLVVGQMHGDEETGKRVVAQLLKRSLPAGVDLWVIPTVNPDGDAANTRDNARGVDLNRNFSVSWIKQGSGSRYYSGPKALSEPESRAVRVFLLDLEPWRTVSFHNPLNGVDNSLTKDPSLVKNLAAWSGYSLKSFTCNGGCHGTMTQFINAKTPGAGVTFEFGTSTSDARITKVTDAILRLAQG